MKRPWTGLYVRTITPGFGGAPGPARHARGARHRDHSQQSGAGWPPPWRYHPEVDDRDVTNGDSLMLDLKKRRIGDQVKLLIERDGYTGTTEMEIGEAPDARLDPG